MLKKNAQFEESVIRIKGLDLRIHRLVVGRVRGFETIIPYRRRDGASSRGAASARHEGEEEKRHDVVEAHNSGVGVVVVER